MPRRTKQEMQLSLADKIANVKQDDPEYWDGLLSDEKERRKEQYALGLLTSYDIMAYSADFDDIEHDSSQHKLLIECLGEYLARNEHLT